MNDIEKLVEISQGADPQRFLGLRIRKGSLGAGGQGTVFLATNPIGKQYAIKFVKPRIDEPERVKERVRKFFNELKILSSISNKNIIHVHTGGYCDLSQCDEKLALVESLVAPQSDEGNYVFFYTMDYYERSLPDLFPLTLTRDHDDKGRVESPERQVILFEKLVHHISKALDYCHAKDLYHNDIKPDNILFSESDETFILVDFGQAQKKPTTKDHDFIRPWPIYHPHYKFDKKPKDNDLYGFSLILFSILESLRRDYDVPRYNALHAILARATDVKVDTFPFSSASSLKDAMGRYFLKTTWNLKLHIGEYLLPSSSRQFIIDSKIRLPVSGSVFTTPEIRRIIDCPDFQRLRGVKQLGPTDFVFPGATHTRFEHSLGTYHLSLRYLESLTRVPEFNETCSSQSEVIKYTALAALLHDIGHYPYSHWIEEIDEFPHGVSFDSHERRASQIISSGKIGELIDREWGINQNLLFAVIGHGQLPPDLTVIKSVVDSVLDVDKLDYLNRDSIHCGVEYGRSLDIGRLLESLHIDKDNLKICLTHKAKTYIMSLLSCRNMMYTDVYWHKTVRALTGMFKYFIYTLINLKVVSKSEMDIWLQDIDSIFISTLIDRVKEHGNNQLLPLIEPFAFKGRNIYKPAFTFNESHIGERKSIIEFFKNVLSSNYGGLVKMGAKLSGAISAKKGVYVGDHDLIIEKTPAKEGKEWYDLENLRIWNTRREEFERQPRKVSGLNDFLNSNRQAFVLCSPSIYPVLRSFSVSDWENIFEHMGAY